MTAGVDRRTDPDRRIRGLGPDERRDQRRAAVLMAGLELFARRGYTRTTIQQLCRRAGISTKSFYSLFSDRHECYLALFTEVSGQLQEEMVSRLAEAPDDEDRAVDVLMRGFVDTLLSDPRRAMVLLGPGRAVTAEVEAIRRTNRQWAARFVEGIWRKYGVSGDHHAIAIALIGGMYDLVSLWLLDGDPADSTSVDTLHQPLLRFYSAVRGGLSDSADPPI